MNEENDIDDLKKLAPSLFSIEKKQLLKVPKDYFENLPSIIQDKVIANKTIWWKSLSFRRLAFGFSFASILLLIGFVAFNNKSVSNEIADSEYFAFQELTSSSFFDNQTESDIDFELFAFNNEVDFTNFSESEDSESLEDFLLETEFESDFFEDEL